MGYFRSYISPPPLLYVVCVNKKCGLLFLLLLELTVSVLFKWGTGTPLEAGGEGRQHAVSAFTQPCKKGAERRDRLSANEQRKIEEGLFPGSLGRRGCGGSQGGKMLSQPILIFTGRQVHDLFAFLNPLNSSDSSNTTAFKLTPCFEFGRYRGDLSPPVPNPPSARSLSLRIVGDAAQFESGWSFLFC